MSDRHEDPERLPLLLAGDDDPWTIRRYQVSRWLMQRRAHLWRPPTDVFENEDAFVVKVEVAGMKRSDFSISFDRRVLTIQGVRGDAGGMKAYHQMEIAYGEFICEVEVSVPIDSGGIEAVYADGFLRVTLPKLKPKNISIES
jgi:HSP20 family protein